jgi:hypothetical protein
VGPFFCQIEAVETIVVWLTEVARSARQYEVARRKAFAGFLKA